MTDKNSTNKKNNEDDPKYVPTDRDGAFIIIFIVILFVFNMLVVAIIMALS